MKTTAQPNIRQGLLYIETSSTALTSNTHGVLLLEDGEIIEPELLFLDHAIRVGWWVIQFPNTALMLDESKTCGLGCECILEKIWCLDA